MKKNIVTEAASFIGKSLVNVVRREVLILSCIKQLVYDVLFCNLEEILILGSTGLISHHVNNYLKDNSYYKELSYDQMIADMFDLIVNNRSLYS